MTNQGSERAFELSDYVNELIEKSRLDDELPVAEPGTQFLKKISKMTVMDLVAKFAQFSAQQNDETMLSSKRKRLYKLTAAIEKELKSRDGDQRRALLILLDDPDPGVRYRVAAATFALDRKRARKVLEQIGKHENFPANAQANTFLSCVASGRFVPM